MVSQAQGHLRHLLLLTATVTSRNLLTRCSDLPFASVPLTHQLKSHVSGLRTQSKRTRRAPDNTSTTRERKTIRGRRSCRHVDDVSALLSPGLTRPPIVNRPRPSRPSTRGRAASSSIDNPRSCWCCLSFGGSQRLRQLQQPPISVSNGCQTVSRGPPRGPEGFRLTKSRVCPLAAYLCHRIDRLKQ